MKTLAIAVIAALLSAVESVAQEPTSTVTLGTLLDEMVDRAALARYPSPSYSCRQFSSYDRASISKEAADTWFANTDRGQYLRVEEREGRQEFVMMDAEGPGAIVRIWSANPAGHLRLYLDGAEEPDIEVPMVEALGGGWGISPPLSAVRSRGFNFYLPIPYAKRCVVTSDEGDFYYQINYRTYEPGTAVQSFNRALFAAEVDHIEEVQERLLSADTPPPAPQLPDVIPPQGQSEFQLPAGPRAIRNLSLRLEHDDLDRVLRTTVLELKFDGQETVWCPVGDFFGTGAGLNPHRDWWRTVGEDGTLSARWVMPYSRSAGIRLRNLGDTPVEFELNVETIDTWAWDEHSMLFHTSWRQENPIETRPMRDWNYVEIAGRGVYVGDNLAVANPVRDWWGEGDEKIYVDGEGFPSHFGTGTEDYYGYAWCSPALFQAPFHNQIRCDGPDNYGHTLVSRVRALDAIPFEASLKFDMEVWHWEDCRVGYAATTYFYALPGAKTNREPSPSEAARGVLDPAPLPPPFSIEGALECEALEVAASSEGIEVGAQGGFGPGLWSGEQQLWVRGRVVGDFVELRVPAEGDGPYRVEVFATRSWNYGVVGFSVNGQPTGVEVDLFNAEERAVAATGAIDLGVHAAVDGALVLRCEVVGSNRLSEGTGAFFGLDCVRLGEAE